MEPVVAVLVVLVAMVVLAVVGAVVAIRYRTRRQRAATYGRSGEFVAWAARSGWSYRPTAAELRDRFTGYPLHHDALPEGPHLSIEVRHAVSGGWHGHAGVAFEFAHWFTSGRYGRPGWSEEPYRLAALGLPAACPYLEVLPREQPERGAPTPFLAWFAVRAGDQAFAGRVLGPELTGWLVATRSRGAVPGLRFAGHDLLCWQEGELTAEWIPVALDFLTAVVSRSTLAP